MGIVNLHDYASRVEHVVREKLRGARVIALIEHDTTMSGEGDDAYWERMYIVAWSRSDQSGTHRVSIDSNGAAACFIGHYDMTETDAKYDALVRAGMSVGRI